MNLFSIYSCKKFHRWFRRQNKIILYIFCAFCFLTLFGFLVNGAVKNAVTCCDERWYFYNFLINFTFLAYRISLWFLKNKQELEWIRIWWCRCKRVDYLYRWTTLQNNLSAVWNGKWAYGLYWYNYKGKINNQLKYLRNIKIYWRCRIYNIEWKCWIIYENCSHGTSLLFLPFCIHSDEDKGVVFDVQQKIYYIHI